MSSYKRFCSNMLVFSRDVGMRLAAPLVDLLVGGVAVGRRSAVNLIQGANVTLTVADNDGTGAVDVTIAAAGGSPGGAMALTVAEQDLGALPRYGGAFDLAGVALAPGKPVLIQQAAGPYTGKGDRADEAEMDAIAITGYVHDATTIRCFWQVPACAGPVRGPVKFQYAVSA
jgi:hypothetical protein